MESRITWDKLVLELELLAQEEPQSALPLLVGVNSVLEQDDIQGWCARTIDFMAYELVALCEKCTEAERFSRLNDFFFGNRDFRICRIGRANPQQSDLLIRTVLNNREGSALPVALLYMHLATQLDLIITLVNQSQMTFVKWSRGGKCHYVNLAENGRLVTEEELLQLIGRHAGLEASSMDPGKLENLSLKKVLSVYLQDLAASYHATAQPDLRHAVLTMLLKLEPHNLKALGDRALVRKSLGFYKESLNDLKRYVSFVELGQAPSDIQAAYAEISAMSSLTAPVLH